MNTTEWQRLQTALGGCLNSGGTFHYNYDGRLGQIIEPYAPNNFSLFPQKPDYETQGEDETLAAIENWVKQSQYTEGSHVTTLAQIHFGEDYDDSSKEKILPLLIEQHKVLERGVVELTPETPKGLQAKMRYEYAGGLFELGWMAVEEFKKSPVAFVRFPDITIEDIRVFGGFYGSPWSNPHNSRTLRMRFLEVNPHFEIHLCTTGEFGDSDMGPGWGSKRKVGVLFTYRSP